MEIERTISSEGIPDGYSFEQTRSNIILKFQVPRSYDLSMIEFSIYDGTIIAGIKGSEPLICGKMFGSIIRENHYITDGMFRIDIKKADSQIWPVFIINPSDQGIDPKSQFILGVYNDALGNENEAFSNIYQSAQRNYFPAQIFVSDIFLSDANPYGVKKDPVKAIQFLESISPEKLTENISLTLANAHLSIGQRSEAMNVLRSISRSSQIAKLQLAKMMSPIADVNGQQPEEAVKLLESLSNEGNLEALELLSKHYLKGIGVKKDKNRSREIEQRIREIDPKYFPESKFSGTAKNVLVAACISTVLIGAVTLIRIWRQQNK
ncbi:hypothetical protein GPJ56_009106 [Histomonas meleagridis]|uniref:uncharacterized protein n=1 Tax=Histomonas meleagridis TaxID=135588 RepID=UPI00355986DE|nr:hypothetical protein GPJ56_009106 [Histomonas meleagridis]KAH0799237.1 hypothetical protein GO595_008034 [Histomonas meleagridis]